MKTSTFKTLGGLNKDFDKENVYINPYKKEAPWEADESLNIKRF